MLHMNRTSAPDCTDGSQAHEPFSTSTLSEWVTAFHTRGSMCFFLPTVRP